MILAVASEDHARAVRAWVRAELRQVRRLYAGSWLAEHNWWARQVAEQALERPVDPRLVYGYRVTQRLARLEFRGELEHV